jgi:hypothetical protein
MKATEVTQYIESLGQTPRHNVKAMARAFTSLSTRLKTPPLDLMKFILSNKPMEGFYTHSYGFHTREGREIINQFEATYYDTL